MIGTTLSHYEITAELGRGGMGIVYKARDTKLDREVAIKVLPAAALANQDDRARFYREAKSAAALNHPNIASIHQIDEAIAVDKTGHQIEASDGPRPFIAMEYIEGGTLEDRIKAGPLKLDEAVGIATQVAEALKAAHAKDIVHRDIKSANIMLTKDGQAKVLDFGLAQTNASTKLTRMNSTLGTVAYMSPEQARGEAVDGRTDLYSLGAVLFEMIVGRLPFGGAYEKAVVYSILNVEPEPLTALRTGVPMELERITNKLLAKSADVRYQSAAGLLADFKGVDFQYSAVSSPRVSSNATPSSAPMANSRSRNVLLAAGSFALGCALVWLLTSWFGGDNGQQPRVHRFEMNVPFSGRITDLSISGDGSTIAYWDSGNSLIYIYDFETGHSRPLAGTSDAVIAELSDDGSSILITTGIGVRRSPTRVGAPLDLFFTQEGTPRANWAPDGGVVYEDEGSIFIRPAGAAEGYPVILSDSTDLEDIDWPSVLPDGKTVMAVIEYKSERRDLGFWDLKTGKERGRLEQGGYRPQYVPSGHIVMVLGSSANPGALVAIPFDLSSLKQTGPVISIADDVTAERMSVSDTGTLIYSGGGFVGTYGPRRLYFLHTDGTIDLLGFPPALYGDIKVSPDGRKAVVTITDGRSTARLGDAKDTFVLDLQSETRLRLTYNLSGGSADWYAGSDSVIYVDNTNATRGEIRVNVRAADGSGSSREVFRSVDGIHDLHAAEDGSSVVYVTGRFGNGNTQLEFRSLVTGEVRQLSDGSPAQRRHPVLSLDGSKVFYEEDSRLYTLAVDGTGVASSTPGNGRIPVWDVMSGLKFNAGLAYGFVHRGVDSPTREAITVPRVVRAMDALPGGNTLLVAIADPTSVEDDRAARSDSTQTVSVVLNLFEDLN